MKTKSIFFYIFLLFIFTNFNTTTCAQAVNVQDSLVLVDLYNSTDGLNWRNHTNWLTGPLKTWYGITVADTSVTEIDLVDNKLSGNIPSELGRLIKLKIL